MRDLGLTNGGEATICISSVSYGGSPACACDAYVLKFLPYVFFLGDPYRGICVGDVDANTKRVRFQLVVMNKQHFSQMKRVKGSVTFHPQNRASDEIRPSVEVFYR